MRQNYTLDSITQDHEIFSDNRASIAIIDVLRTTSCAKYSSNFLHNR